MGIYGTLFIALRTGRSLVSHAEAKRPEAPCFCGVRCLGREVPSTSAQQGKQEKQC